jgi:hypothetical protein
MSEIDIFTDATSAFPLSQESTKSTVSTDSMPAAALTNKRSLETEEDGEDTADDEEAESFQHFNSFSPPPLYFNNASSARVLAKPKSRRKTGSAAQGQAVAQTIAASDLEFEEAGFLQPWEEGDAEVEMGGT